MNSDLLESLIMWKNGFISGTDLKIVLLDKSDNARKSIVKRAISEGFLESVKQDLFLIKKIPNKLPVHPFEIAQLIYGPSYISFESALSYAGWIPETVLTICSATIKASKIHHAHRTCYSYEKIPNAVFSLGVDQKSNANATFLIANPWKAIADIIYKRKKNWSNLTAMMGDMRIEHEEIHEADKAFLKEISEQYPNKRTQNILSRIYQEVESL